MIFIPEHLKRWTLPPSYFGAEWHAYYSAGVGQSRDSDAIERSNFAVMLRELKGECETVRVVRESHWAVGWVEWIAIHESDELSLRIADRLQAQLDDYPVLDEEHFSTLEWEEAADYWDQLSPRAKVQMAMGARAKYHWLSKVPVWPFGKMDYCTLVDNQSCIAESLVESLRS